MYIDISIWRSDKAVYLMEKLFSTNDFEADDAVLVGYEMYFDEKEREYNKFCIDDKKDMALLYSFINSVSLKDPDCRIYVCTYGYEIETNDSSKRFSYADQIWLDTSLSPDEIGKLISETSVSEPTEIKYLHECHDTEYKRIFLVTCTDMDDIAIKEYAPKCFNDVITLFWD